MEAVRVNPATEVCRLAPTAFFRKVGSEVYVRNVATGEEFLFNAEAAPVFAALRRGAARNAPVLRGNTAFVRQLKSLGLVPGARKNRPPGLRRGAALPVGALPVADNAPPDIAGHCQDVCQRTNRLWSAGLELTWRCNARCRHCYLDIPEEQTAAGELDEAEWLSVVDQLSRMGCMNVLVTGGEPTLHSAFLPVCERIVKRGMLCDIYTNGIAIPDSVFDAIVALPVNSVSVSLYSGSEAFHDEITGVQGSFRKTLDTLLKLRKTGLHAYAKAPMFHGHLDDFFAARELGRRHGFPVNPANILVPGHSGESRNAMMLDDGEYMAFLMRERAPDPAADTEEARISRLGRPACQAGRTTLCVAPDGAVRPCNSFPMDCGNVRSSSLSQIWRQSEPLRQLRSLRFRDISPRCADCADAAFCTICLGASWNETRGQFVPCSWSCGQTSVRAAFNRKRRIQK